MKMQGVYLHQLQGLQVAMFAIVRSPVYMIRQFSERPFLTQIPEKRKGWLNKRQAPGSHASRVV